MELTEILEIPGLPTLPGVAGEVEALKYIFECRACEADTNLLFGISGILFRFFVPDDPTTITADSLLQYKELIDGPEPTRLAARFCGWQYIPHLQNSIGSFFKKAVDAIQKDIPAITRDQENPSTVNVIIGYALNNSNQSVKKLFMKNLNNSHNPIEINLPPNQEEAIIEQNQWRNFIGISEYVTKPDKQRQQKEIKLAMNRALCNLKPHYIGDGFWVAGAAAFAKLENLLNYAQTNELVRKLLNVIFMEYYESRSRLVKFLSACEKFELGNYDEFLLESVKLPAIGLNIIEFLKEYDTKQILKIDRIMKEVESLKTTEFKLIENLAAV